MLKSMEMLDSYGGILDSGELIFLALLAFTILMMLYSITLIHRKFRVLEGELTAIRKDQSVISEELELIVSLGKELREKKPPETSPGPAA